VQGLLVWRFASSLKDMSSSSISAVAAVAAGSAMVLVRLLKCMVMNL
jgi:hypothetical protein